MTESGGGFSANRHRNSWQYGVTRAEMVEGFMLVFLFRFILEFWVTLWLEKFKETLVRIRVKRTLTHAFYLSLMASLCFLWFLSLILCLQYKFEGPFMLIFFLTDEDDITSINSSLSPIPKFSRSRYPTFSFYVLSCPQNSCLIWTLFCKMQQYPFVPDEMVFGSSNHLLNFPRKYILH